MARFIEDSQIAFILYHMGTGTKGSGVPAVTKAVIAKILVLLLL